MSKRAVRLCLCLTLLTVACAVSPAAAQSLLVCGWDEVYQLDLASMRKTFSWTAASAPELPDHMRTKFRTTDDCKPVSGNRVLITASSDGAALVDRTTGRTMWWGACGNAHSAELLPGDRLVLACSVREGTGNKLALFDVRSPERELFGTGLVSGHGVVWDARRERLWAIGLDVLRAYRLVEWDSETPALALDREFRLPDTGGHELQAVPGSPDLVLSTHASVWRFDRDRSTFRPDPDLAGLHDVKSVSVHPGSGRVAYTRADSPDWWTTRIGFRQPDGEVVRDGERLYKVRWVP
jgi:hypothetical protein